MKTIFIIQLLLKAKDDLVFFYEWAEVSQIFYPAYDFSIFISEKSGIFQDMNFAAAFFLKNTFTLPYFTLFEQGAIFVFTFLPGAKTGVTAKNFARLAFYLFLGVTGKLLKGRVYKDNFSVRVNEHQTFHHCVYYCLPILAINFFQHISSEKTVLCNFLKA